ncbi:uncharacterized protein LOC143557632 [Bidens hawaiensis]|uniref:uncharacterized protein LOC143557632 n=1 Tax=Bidens hawaiensis TaxID=980011 RepID=UPI00404B547C
MAFYMDEEQAFKCHKHSSRRRKTGICPKCLRDRLLTLCPECANTRPCTCSPIPTDTSPSSSSSPAPFSLFSFSRGGSRHVTGTTNCSGDACPLPNHHEGDPSLRKSRSVAISFLRSRSRHVGNVGCDNNNNNNNPLPPKVSRSKINFWSMFSKSKRSDIVHDDGVVEDMNIKSDDMMVVDDDDDNNNNNSSMMMRSRSVAVGAGNRLAPVISKQRGWYFPSPINAFRHSKSPLSVTVT